MLVVCRATWSTSSRSCSNVAAYASRLARTSKSNGPACGSNRILSSSRRRRFNLFRSTALKVNLGTTTAVRACPLAESSRRTSSSRARILTPERDRRPISPPRVMRRAREAELRLRRRRTCWGVEPSDVCGPSCGDDSRQRGPTWFPCACEIRACGCGACCEGGRWACPSLTPREKERGAKREEQRTQGRLLSPRSSLLSRKAGKPIRDHEIVQAERASLHIALRAHSFAPPPVFHTASPRSDSHRTRSLDAPVGSRTPRSLRTDRQDLVGANRAPANRRRQTRC